MRKFMKTTASLLYEIDYGSSKDDVLSKLPLLADKINNIVLKIKECETIEDAEYYIALLESIHSLIIRLKFKKGLEIWGSLWEFTRHLDRIDAEITQKIIFDEIKNGEFPLIDKNNLF
jgi:hypothetical protein